MLKITVLFLVFIVFFVLTLRLAVMLMGRIAGKYVTTKHKAAEMIVNTGRAPKDWTYKFEERITSIRKTTESLEKISRIERRAKDVLLKKIDQLIEYFKTSPLIQDKDTRQILLDGLQEARRLWKEKNWEEIIAS